MLSSLAGRAVRSAPRILSTPHTLSVTPRLSRTAWRTYSVAVESERDPVELDRLTTLKNGIRVATEALVGHFSGIGVYIDAGSRYEDDSLRGVSHIVDRLAFKSTKRRTGDEMLESIESLGGNIQCASSREALIYQSATFNNAVDTTIGLLAETIRDPRITDDEVTQQLITADYEIGEIWSKPELILPELVHMAAFKDNTLGNPLLCPKERLPEIDRKIIDAYRRRFFKPERMVVAFAGVEHSEAVKLAERYFGDMERGVGPFLDDVRSPLQLDSNPPSLTAPALYTGGFLSLPNLPPPANPAYPRLSHIHVAFEGLPITSPDIYTLATLQTLLGGGGSFSAGGPGKGMYSRLYTNVLNQHGWVESCTAFNHSYNDSGLFGIAASCIPTHVAPMLDVICRELAALTGESEGSGSNGKSRNGPSSFGLSRLLSETEVTRAKNQLKSGLLMNLESRMVELEDLGRQVQVHGRKIGAREMCAKIDEITIKDLQRVARMVFGGKASKTGSGAPTVVLQEAAPETKGFGSVVSAFSGGRRSIGWGEIQERIARWKLGRI